MKVVDRHIIRRTHNFWQVCDELAFKSKNLYNLANYHCRQHFFCTGKSLSLTKLYHATKDSDAYRALPTKVSKQIIKCLVASWRGYFQAIKEWSKYPGKFLGKPKIPKYKNKTQGRNVVIYSKESVYKAPLKDGICHLSMSEIKIPVIVETVIEVRIVPATSCYIIEVVYEKANQPQIHSTYVAGIDLGIDRLVALSTNKPGVKPMLVNGKPLKSVNQLYNKRKAKYQSHLKGNRKSSRKIEALTYHRNRFVENYLHNTSKLVVNYLVTNNIGTVVIGKNDNWKQGANIGKKNNQNFTQIPHDKLLKQITYKCQLAGIKVIETEESYTSKTSALDLEQPIKHETYRGKRVKRGLFRSGTGIVINADVNGSLQIIRKKFPEAFSAEGIVSCAVQPVLVNPISR
ncbi:MULTISPECIES: RNA-guided endonuclease InsQ/TnpB family protein [Okeania]|uniref:RNA-guided endonuclease InsQ/TnpB family protein n=2 Tax=Microcoleaceae TaxID=1892252 RepID=UPI000F53040F|nr:MULTISPECIES: RNA-guided endonuclease TnpB family protein [Okeania]NEQ74921.1 IS200/IS605 family element transposase accessory protein TnpB [Okeania sp. SIO2C9]NET77921.1 IS200/IS605 family element transposase accessory protein TnpB [Okeania sp. SIO1F9]RQH16794.1 transposase [Okeania hirsuta]